MHTKRKLLATIGVGASLAVVAIAATPVLAHSTTSVRLAGPGLKFNSTSTSFAGWVFKPAAATSVTSVYKVPPLKCTPTTSGVGPGSFMLTGTTASPIFDAAGILLECNGGSPASIGVVLVDGVSKTSTTAPQPGDVIKTTITNSATKTVATTVDTTAAHHFVITISGAGHPSLQEMIMDDSLVSGTTQLPVANFARLVFGAAAVSGHAIGTVTPRTAFNMVSSTHVLQISTGLIGGTNHNTFPTIWHHA